MRRLYLAVVGLLGVAVAVLPGLAAGDPPSTASFTAVDYAWQSGGGTTATIAQGGTVSFAYPTGSSSHNVDFGAGPQPSSCAQAAGASSGSVPPLPNRPTGPGWSGSCTFNTPGTYTFQCDLHPFMTGTIVVQASGSTTATTPTTPSSPTTSTTPSTPTATPSTPAPAPPAPPHAASPLAGAAANAISVPAAQRGTAVKGTVKISAAGAGGRLEVEVFAIAGSLHASGRGLVRVARLTLAPIRAGIERFSVPLNGRAKRALHRHKLAVTVLVTVRSAGGTTVTGKRNVLLRR